MSYNDDNLFAPEVFICRKRLNKNTKLCSFCEINAFELIA